MSINQAALIDSPSLLAEQHCVVAKVDTMMALFYQLETALAAVTRSCARLLDTLIRAALSPDLSIPQVAE